MDVGEYSKGVAVSEFDSDRENEITIVDFFGLLWQNKIRFMLIVFSCTLITGGISILKADKYRSDALLAPAITNSSSGLSGKFSGLASMIGFGMGGAGVDKSALGLEILRSKQFIINFINKYDLYPYLFAVKKWDAKSNSLIFDEVIYDAERKVWKSDKPSSYKAYRKFMAGLNVSTDKNSNMVSVSIDIYSPYLAKQWLTLIIKELNEDMREREMQDAKKSISYLESQIRETNVSDVQVALFSLIEEQTKTLMLTNVREEYVFKVVDPPFLSELKASPNRILYVIAGVFLGLILNLFVVLVKIIRQQK